MAISGSNRSSLSRGRDGSFGLASGHRIEQEIFAPHERSAVAIRWRLLDQPESETLGDVPTGLARQSDRSFRVATTTRCITRTPPFALRQASPANAYTWRPYDGVPGVRVLCPMPPIGKRRSGIATSFTQQEAERGLDATEDLASPGEFRWNLAAGDAVWIAIGCGLARFAIRKSAPMRSRPSKPAIARSWPPGEICYADSSDRPMPISSAAAPAARSSPAILGSPTGAATRSSRSAVCASRPVGSTSLARSCSLGPASSPKACCPIDFLITAMRRNSTPSTPRSGTWSPSTTICRLSKRVANALAADDRHALAARPSGRSWKATFAARATESTSTTMGCWRPVSLACNSPGWT